MLQTPRRCVGGLPLSTACTPALFCGAPGAAITAAAGVASRLPGLGNRRPAGRPAQEGGGVARRLARGSETDAGAANLGQNVGSLAQDSGALAS